MEIEGDNAYEEEEYSDGRVEGSEEGSEEDSEEDSEEGSEEDDSDDIVDEVDEQEENDNNDDDEYDDYDDDDDEEDDDDDDDDGTELSESDVEIISMDGSRSKKSDNFEAVRSEYSGTDEDDTKDDLRTLREIGSTLHLSEEEKKRALKVFKHCDTFDENTLNAQQFGVALALLGQIETQDKVKELFEKHEALTRKISVNKSQFLKMFDGLRKKTIQEEVLRQIEIHFHNLYEGMCDDDSNKDNVGGRFLPVSKFREILTSQGDVLTDEEADEMIIECQPIYELDTDGTKIGKIYFDGYRTMILDSSFQLVNNKPKPSTTKRKVDRKSMVGKTVTDFVSKATNMFS